MGGFTVIYLKDRSEENIAKQNHILDKLKVPKKYRFYSFNNVEKEYQYYLKKDGNYPEHLFPPDRINSFDDFLRYWNPDAVGEIFVPYTGSLSFDCYFGRTSKHAMRQIGKYVSENANDILAVSGSFETFMERGMNKWEQKYIGEKISSGSIRDTHNVKNLFNSPYTNIYEK